MLERTGMRKLLKFQTDTLPIASTSGISIVLRQAFGHAVGIFAKNTFLIDPVDLLRSVVVAGLNPCEPIFAVHDVGLTIHDRAAIQPWGEQVTRVNVTARSNFGGGERSWILICRKSSRLGH